MHIASNERRQWLQAQMEQSPAPRNQAHILTQLIRADNLRAGDPIPLSRH